MQATIDSRGEVRIAYNMQAEYLEAPDGLRYLPCDGGCGRLLKVAPNVVSSVCDKCRQKMKSGIRNITGCGDAVRRYDNPCTGGHCFLIELILAWCYRQADGKRQPHTGPRP